jgi:two-component system, NarL family, response regulator DevR
MVDKPRPLRVFIVDDSALVKQRVLEVLKTVGFVEIVGHADSVQGALQQIPLAHPDVVLLDLGLPDGSGLVVLREIQKLDRPPVAAVLTNYATPSLRKRCLAAGARVFLDKSHEFERIPDVMKELAGMSGDPRMDGHPPRDRPPGG